MVGKNIKARRKELRITQQQLADRIETVSRQAVQKWEAGDNLPRSNHWSDLDRALEAEPGWMEQLARQSGGAVAYADHGAVVQAAGRGITGATIHQNRRSQDGVSSTHAYAISLLKEAKDDVARQVVRLLLDALDQEHTDKG